MKKGEPKIEVIFSLDLNHILTVSIKESKNQIETFKQFTKENLYLPKEKVDEMLKIALINRELDEIKEKELQLSSQIYNYINILRFYPDLVVENDIIEFEKSLSNKNINELTQLMNNIIEKYPFVLVKPNITPFNDVEIEEITNEIEEFDISCDLSKEEEYNVLVTNLINNLSNFELSVNKQQELIDFIEFQKKINDKDYDKMINELNNYCEKLS
jgi:molecular chaperone DnaK (HSP70)